LSEPGDGALGFGGEAAVPWRERARALALAAGREALAAGREVVARGDREVAQGGQDLRRHAMAHLAAVFIVGAVAAVVQCVLDAPVGLERGTEREFAEWRGRTAGEREDRLGLYLAVGKLAAAVHAHDLRDVREG